MKKAMFNEEVKTMSLEQLKNKANDLRRELFSLRLNAATGHVKDTANFKVLRRNIARVLTAMQQKKA